ncbi:Myrcene synthase, chloroplastic [Musa troglodytarum]|uniref:Myrcene synthase, chloroplastic n=1 Tax=Musa troglodytarum TaxID=320322 RepID=A0A9E7GRK3_9LILI|nr:Myrcene synthase, chloroplastic [Musa troglodytarum]
MLDDVYDIYGTLNELELFIEAIERWDANAIDKLPDYMKLCFLAIFNAANETGYRVTKEKGLDIIPCLRKAQQLDERVLESVATYPKVARCSAMLLRLYNDLATSTIELERGDAPSSIQCYMLESGVPEMAARKKIRELIKANWRGINGDRGSSFGEIFTTVAVGLPRMSQFIYQHGDGYSAPDGKTRKQIMSLLFEPLQLSKL